MAYFPQDLGKERDWYTLFEISYMKNKLFNLITVFLATSGWLVPAQAVTIGHTLERHTDVEETHLVCVKQAQHFLCDFESGREAQKAHPLYHQGTTDKGDVKATKATQNHNSSHTTVVPPLLSPAQQKSVSDLLLGLIYFVLPGGLVLGIFLYDKYCVYRTALIKQQIENLERLWQSDLDNDATTKQQIENLERLWQSDSDSDATTDTGRETKE